MEKSSRQTYVTNTRHCKTPELLAPAGSQESFHAAIEAGADAIYLGVDQLNARLRAKNFTLQTLSYLVPYAHKKGIKIYVTLNTLVKQSEMQGALKVVQQLSEMGVDAIIVQDIGFAAAVSRHFPAIDVHGSTQMGIHNSIGALAAKKLGVKRVILARELSVEEIRKIQKAAPIETEIFIHGALCYSFSGLCLASSYLGGLSGNRGRCTQVCRRRFFSKKQSGFFFSPRDFSALDFMEALAGMNIASFKIEGRMRSAEYVHTVVSAFRKLLDTPDRIDETREMLRFDFGREKASLFLGARQPSSLITADRPSGTGLLLGAVCSSDANTISIRTDERLCIGDRLRIHGQAGFEGKAARIVAVDPTGSDSVAVTLTEALPAKTGDLVYLVGRKKSKSSSWNIKKVPVRPARYSREPGRHTDLLSRYNKNSFVCRRQTGERVSVRVDNPGWLYMLHKDDYRDIQFAGTLSDCRTLLQNRNLINRWRQRLSIVLPPYISEHDLSKWRELLKQFSSMGIRLGVASQFGQNRLFPADWELTADYLIWATNRFSQHFIAESGYQRFTYSPEDDFVNMRATVHRAGIVLVFGHIPLFVSRIKPGIEPGSLLIDPKNESFLTMSRGELYYLLGKKPLSLTHRHRQLSEAGLSHYLIDLCFISPHKKTIKNILQAWHSNSKIPETTIFNHKFGLK